MSTAELHRSRAEQSSVCDAAFRWWKFLWKTTERRLWRINQCPLTRTSYGTIVACRSRRTWTSQAHRPAHRRNGPWRIGAKQTPGLHPLEWPQSLGKHQIVTLRLRYKVDRPSAVMETGRGRPIWVVGAAQELYGASACWPSSASAYLLAISPSVVDGAGERAQFRRVKTQKKRKKTTEVLSRQAALRVYFENTGGLKCKPMDGRHNLFFF
jgi:hypothetical protein